MQLRLVACFLLGVVLFAVVWLVLVTQQGGGGRPRAPATPAPVEPALDAEPARQSDVGVAGDVAPEAAAVLHGRVLDAGGGGVAGASVLLVSLARSRSLAAMVEFVPGHFSFEAFHEALDGRVNVVRTRSGPDGAYGFASADVAPGVYRLSAARAEHGRGQAEEQLVLDPFSAAPREVDVTLAGGGSITGRVTASGERVAGATVRAVPSWLRARVLRSEYDVEADVREALVLSTALSVTTLQDGAFHIDGLPQEPFDLRITHADHAAAYRLDLRAPASVDVALEPNATLRGRVASRSSGAPIANARVVVGMATSELAALRGPALLVELHPSLFLTREVVTATDGDGRFTAPWPTGMDCRVRVIARDHLELEEELDIAAVAGHSVAAPVELGEFAVDPLVELRGRVVTHDGKPAAGALVRVRRIPGERVFTFSRAESEVVFDVLAEAATDNTGRFVARAPSMSPFIARAFSAAGVASDSVVSPASGVTLRLGVAEAVAGVVVSAVDATPIAGADVRVVSGNRELPLCGARTDTHGRFVLECLDAFQAQMLGIHVSHPRFKDSYATPLTQEMRVELFPPVRVHGRVLGEDGAPVAGAGVVARQSGWRMSPGVEQAVASSVSDDDGTFALTTATETADPSGVVHLEARHPRSGVGDRKVSRLGETVVFADIVLEAWASLRGRVLTLDGSPIRGARVRVPGAWTRGLLARTFGSRDAVALSDAEGRYLVDGLRRREREVEVTAPGYVTLRVEVELDGAVERDWVLEPEAQLRGSVVDSEGAPVRGANVFLILLPQEVSRDPLPEGEREWEYWHGETSREEVVATSMSGGDGTFTIHGAGRRAYGITAIAPGYALSRPYRIEAPVEDCTVTLAALGRLVVRVVNAATGQPVRRIRLNLHQEWERRLAAGSFRIDRSDADGVFALPALVPGSYKLSIGAVALQEFDTELEILEGKTSDVLAELDPGGTLSGQILDAVDRAAVAGAHVSYVHKDGNGDPVQSMVSCDPVRTRSDGRFEFSGLSDGAYELRVQHQQYVLDGVVSATVTNGLCEPLSLELHRAGVVTVRPRGLESEIGVSSILLRSTEGELLRTWTLGGRRVFTSVAPGRYDVVRQARAGGAFVLLDSITLAPGEHKVLEYDLSE